jgi:peptidoglycan-associated lipoprotein
MKNTVLALASTLFLLAACDSALDGSSATGAGANGVDGSGTTGILGQAADGTSIGDRVFFELNSSALGADSQATLGRQAEWLKANTSTNVTIEGHADERGTREFNIALGERRATAAKNYLVSLGVPASRLSVISYGKERPAVVGNDESSWSQNRRAVTVIAN